jgi:acyl carrier protein
MATIMERLKRVIAEELGVDEEAITPEASFTDDLNADSSDLAELMAVIEEAFSTPKQRVIIPDEAIEEVVTVKDLADLLHEYIAED